MEKLSKIKELVASVEKDVDKFHSLGNVVSGIRLRKAMQDLKILAQKIRVELTEKKNAK